MAHHTFKPTRINKKTGKRIASRYYTGQYRLEGDTSYTRVPLRVTDKRAADRKLDQIVQQEERRRAGLLLPEVQTQAANTPLLDLLDAFIRYQKDRKLTHGYIRKLDQRLRRLLDECRWERIANATADSFIAWRHRQALSPKTLNDYLQAAHTLFEWLKKTGRIDLNPFEKVDRVDNSGPKTFERRALTDDEVKRLLAVNEQRRAIYLVALHTGLRLDELRRLQWSDIDLEHRLIRLRAEATKSKRADVLPITQTAHAALQQQATTSNAAGKVFAQGVPSHHTFQSDLTAAGIPRFDHRGLKADFHALRKTFITNLQRSGVSQRMAMALARHTDPRLTADIYTDQDALPLAEAAAKLPTYDDAHIDAHGMVAERPTVSQPDAFTINVYSPEVFDYSVLAGDILRQDASPTDTEQKWSRGDSNPRAVTVSKYLLRT